MSKVSFYDIDDTLRFGKHKGETLRDVLKRDPGYFVWCLDNLDHLKLSEDVVETISEEFPDMGDLIRDEYAEVIGFEDYDNDNVDELDGAHYGAYAGSYAQDVEGFSDEVIDEAFEGNPDAYWNID